MKIKNLFKDRTFDKDAFQEVAVIGGILLFVATWILLCFYWPFFGIATLILLFVGLPLFLFAMLLWELFNKIFPKTNKYHDDEW